MEEIEFNQRKSLLYSQTLTPTEEGYNLGIEWGKNYTIEMNKWEVTGEKKGLLKLLNSQVEQYNEEMARELLKRWDFNQENIEHILKEIENMPQAPVISSKKDARKSYGLHLSNQQIEEIRKKYDSLRKKGYINLELVQQRACRLNRLLEEAVLQTSQCIHKPTDKMYSLDNNSRGIILIFFTNPSRLSESTNCLTYSIWSTSEIDLEEKIGRIRYYVKLNCNLPGPK